MQVADIRILTPEEEISLTTRVGQDGALLTFEGPHKQASLTVSLSDDQIQALHERVLDFKRRGQRHG
jgi:hypothetical protein